VEAETDLTLVPLDDDISSLSLVNTSDGGRVRVIAEGEKWPPKAAKVAFVGKIAQDALGIACASVR
jgi:hypothetical protein